MIRNEYVNRLPVNEFIIWIEEKLDNKNAFIHKYTMKKPAMKWNCSSIYSAYENYYWPFKSQNPINGEIVSGKTFLESLNFLNRMRTGLKESIIRQDIELVRKFCFAILSWGGVLPRNDKKIIELEDTIIDYFIKVKEILNPEHCNIENSFNNIIMNSGFTKIYSVLIDDFIIYDGRVGAALGLLVRRFCEEKGIDTIPQELLFAFGKGRESKPTAINRRDPSLGRYKFPNLQNNPIEHIRNNIKANWLLKEILLNTNSKFNNLDKSVQMRALEAALFMIGYDVRSA
jgi:hypothetical protein